MLQLIMVGLNYVDLCFLSAAFCMVFLSDCFFLLVLKSDTQCK